jgi:hypothetical protein
VEALGGEEGGGTRRGRAVTSSAAELTVERGEGEAGEDFSSQPTCVDKAAGDDRDSRWRRQGRATSGDRHSGVCAQDRVTGRRS